MESASRPGTPLRQRMLEDMRMRKFAEHTQAGHVRTVRELAVFLGRSSDSATTENLRRCHCTRWSRAPARERSTPPSQG